MTLERFATLGAWILALTGLAALARATSFPSGSDTMSAARGRASRASAAAVAPYPADSLGARVVARDLFRADRMPAPAPYDPDRAGAPSPVSPPKPALTLSGIVWGAVPEAIVEGIPGKEAPQVMRQGETAAGLTLRRIEATQVVIVGLDTTWTLTVRQPWP